MRLDRVATIATGILTAILLAFVLVLATAPEAGADHGPEQCTTSYGNRWCYPTHPEEPAPEPSPTEEPSPEPTAEPEPTASPTESPVREECTTSYGNRWCYPVVEPTATPTEGPTGMPTAEPSSESTATEPARPTPSREREAPEEIVVGPLIETDIVGPYAPEVFPARILRPEVFPARILR